MFPTREALTDDRCPNRNGVAGNTQPNLAGRRPVLWDWSIDGWIIATAMLCSLSGALLGCFLVLRRLSLLGDAISHAVLPGIVGAYWLTGSVATLPMWLGAIAVGLLTVWLTEATRNLVASTKARQRASSLRDSSQWDW